MHCSNLGSKIRFFFTLQYDAFLFFLYFMIIMFEQTNSVLQFYVKFDAGTLAPEGSCSEGHNRDMCECDNLKILPAVTTHNKNSF